MTNNNKYYAFISYRHADNTESGRQWASWLHHAIETYEVPTDLVGSQNLLGEEIPSRIFPVFRDEQALPADSDLGNAITKALDDSRLLIVLCSPRAAQSTYVADEVEHFKKQGRSDRIIAAILDGEPNVSWDKAKQQDGFNPADECFPRPLMFKYDAQGNPTDKYAEPIAADFRYTRGNKKVQGWTSPSALKKQLEACGDMDKKTIDTHVNNYQQQLKLMLLKIIAAILAVPLESLTQRDKAYQLQQEKIKAQKLRRWCAAIGVLAILALCATVLAFYHEDQAQQQYQLAVKAQQQAELARDQALTTQSRYLADLARQQKQKGNDNLALLLALNAVPGPYGGENRPRVEEADQALADAMHGFNTIDILEGKQYLGHFAQGQKVLLQHYGKSLYLWDRRANTVEVLAEDIGKRIESARIYESRNLVVVKTDHRTLKSFDLNTGEPIAEFESSSIYNPLALHFSEQGGKIIAEERNAIYLLSAYTLEKDFHLDVAFSRNQTLWQLFLNDEADKALLSIRPGNGPADAAIKIIDLNSREPLFDRSFAIPAYHALISSFVEQDGFWLSSTENKKQISMFKLTHNRYQFAGELNFDSEVNAIVYDSKHQYVAVTEGKNLHIYQNGEKRAQLVHDKRFNHGDRTYIKYSADGQHVMVSLDHQLYIWDLNKHNLLAQKALIAGESNLLPQNNFDFIAEGPLVAATVRNELDSGYYYLETRSWNLGAEQQQQQSTQTREVDDFALTANGDIILLSNLNSTFRGGKAQLQRLELQRGQDTPPELIRAFPAGIIPPVKLIAEQSLLVQHDTSFREQYELLSHLHLSTGEDTQEYGQNPKHTIIEDGDKRRFPRIKSMLLSQDQKQFFTASNTGEITSRQVENGQVNWLYQSQGLDPKLAKSPNDAWLAVGGRNKQLDILQAEQGTTSASFVHQGNITSLVFHPHQNLLASADDTGALRLFDVDAQQQLLQLDNGLTPQQISFNFDGSLLASCSNGQSRANKVKVYRVTTGQRVAEKLIDKSCRSMLFSPVTNEFVTVTRQGELTLWSVEQDAPLAVLNKEVNHCTNRFSKDGEQLFSSCDRGPIQVYNLKQFANGLWAIINNLPRGQKCLSDDARKRFFLPPRPDNQKQALSCQIDTE